MNKKNILLLSVLCLFFVFGFTSSAIALEYTPNVGIPNSIFDGDTITVSEGGGNFVGEYIVALYKYGAMIAGTAAIFMLVLSGWKWLMAAGNAQKINSAKETISGVLVGLALLFGGQLLLSQISEGLVDFKDLYVAAPEVKDFCESEDCSLCTSVALTSQCGSAGATQVADIATKELFQCWGGLNCSDSKKQCMRLSEGSGSLYVPCTIEYMMEKGEDLDGSGNDCICIGAEIYNPNALRFMR